MKVRISDNTKKLLYYLGGIVLVIAAFFLGFQQLRQENKQLKQTQITLKDEMTNLNQIQQNQDQYEAMIADSQSQLKKYYEEFPPLVQARDQILYAADLEKRYDTMFISHISMDEAEYVSGTDQDAIALYKVGTQMECVVSYEQLKDFLVRAGEDGTRKAVDEILLTFDTETGLLAGVIHMNMYYMTGTQQTYQPEEIRDINTGTQNIFQGSGGTIAGSEGAEGENIAEPGNTAAGNGIESAE